MSFKGPHHHRPTAISFKIDSWTIMCWFTYVRRDCRSTECCNMPGSWSCHPYRHLIHRRLKLPVQWLSSFLCHRAPWVWYLPCALIIGHCRPGRPLAQEGHWRFSFPHPRDDWTISSAPCSSLSSKDCQRCCNLYRPIAFHWWRWHIPDAPPDH